jgi:hypothetical protein
MCNVCALSFHLSKPGANCDLSKNSTIGMLYILCNDGCMDYGGDTQHGTLWSWHGRLRRWWVDIFRWDGCCKSNLVSWITNTLKTPSGMYTHLTTTYCTGRVCVYGGHDANNVLLSTVEMMSTNGKTWLTLPTQMYRADAFLSSVPLP